MPWKNGQGSTTEIAVEPEGAGLDAFTWRLSIADIGGPGPFSIFPGIERILVQTAGEPMMLAHGDGQPGDKRHRLAPLVPYRFAGEWPTFAELAAPPARDFNVMARRDRVCGSMTVHDLRRGSAAHFSAAAATQVVHAFRGSFSVGVGATAQGERWQLGAGETLILTSAGDGSGATAADGAQPALTIAAEVEDAVAFVIAFS